MNVATKIRIVIIITFARNEKKEPNQQVLKKHTKIQPAISIAMILYLN